MKFSRVFCESFERYGVGCNSYDQELGWDWSDPGDLARLWLDVQREKQRFIIMSPLCQAMSNLQNFNPDRFNDPKFRYMFKEAVGMIQTCIELAEFQLNTNNEFIFEAPNGAQTSQLKNMKTFIDRWWKK